MQATAVVMVIGFGCLVASAALLARSPAAAALVAVMAAGSFIYVVKKTNH